MNASNSKFGFINGLATSCCFIPPVIALALMLIFGWGSEITIPLFIAFAIGTRFTGDWLFWNRMFPTEMNLERSIANWRSSAKDILFSQPDALRSCVDMVIDAVADGFLIYMALKVSIPPIGLFLAFLLCQTIAAPIQGIIVDHSNKKNCRTFAMVVTIFAVVTALGINDHSMLGLYTHLFGLDHFAVSTQMLIVLCMKCLFAGTTVLAKSTIAGCIQTEVKRKFGKI